MSRYDDTGLFSIPDFLGSSAWLDQAFQESEVSLLSCDITSLPKPSTSISPTTPNISLDHDGFFKLPSLIPDNKPALEPDITSLAELNSETDSSDETHDSGDIWLGEEIRKKLRPDSKTWQDFTRGTKSPYKPSLLSETVLPGLEELLDCQRDNLELNNSDVPTISTKQLLSSLLELSLGRESVLFKRHSASSLLLPTLSTMRIRGYSQLATRAVYTTCAISSQSIDKLRRFVDDAYSTMASKSHIALASTIEQVLQALYRYVTGLHFKPQSVLQLQATVADIKAIAQPCSQFLEQITPQMTDVAVISAVFRFASSTDDSNHFSKNFARELLQKVAAPWLDFASEWLGTKSESSVPLSKAELNSTKGFVSVAAESYVDDFGRELETVDFRLQEEKIPSFLPEDVARSIFETGCSLRFIKSFHPEHPLSSQRIFEISQPPQLRFLYTWAEIIELEDRVLIYRDKLWNLVQESKLQQPDKLQDKILSDEHFQFAFFGKDQHSMEETMSASMRHLDTFVQIDSGDNTIDSAVSQQFYGQPLANDSYLTPHWSLIPTLAFSGIASAQAQVVGRECLRLLFDEHDIQQHLDTQKEFHLFGNGLFCNRLSQALFNPEFDSAERSSGAAFSGGTLGLRLGGRVTWPPASSELRLALMGILIESHSQRHGSGKTGDPVLPGDLSFAVRDLSAEEIDQCMDPNSLHALDFLRLSYQTPPALTSVITPIALLHYDRIFKFLLRVIRMLHVVDQTYREFMIEPQGCLLGHTESRFVREAKHFVSNFAAYIFDTAIAVPWQKLIRIQQEMHEQLQRPLCSDTSFKHTLSPEYLRDSHERILHEIAANIFIRKRQRPILALVEEIFSLVLQFAKTKKLNRRMHSEGSDGSYDCEQLYYEFKQHIQVFITVCRKLSEKMASEATVDDGLPDRYGGVAHDSLIDQLLFRLDFDNFYVK